MTASDRGHVLPLARLGGFAETVLYPGPIRHGDGEDDRARVAAGRAVVPAFGAASECGSGRTDPARVPGLLDGHHAAALYQNQMSQGGGSR